jgi:hypothetical protein
MFEKYKIALANSRRSPLAPLNEGCGVYTSLEIGEVGVNPPNPLNKGAKIRILVPLVKWD